jgi:nephrocystin-3
VIRHILMEIKERYHLSDDIPTDDAQLRDEFPQWLAKIGMENGEWRTESGKSAASSLSTLRSPLSTQKLVLFIDALNQLTGIAPEMHWLPDFIPENVRLILSTTPDVPLAELRKRNWKELEMKPLTGQQVQTIAKQFLGQYRKQLDFAQLAMLSLDEKTQRPLFLRTMLEELRVHGSHRSLSDRLAHYLESESEADLFQRVLARLEEDHGEETVRSVMTAIWAARFGLSEHEIIRVTGLTRVRLSELLIAIEYHLMQREQLFTFFHNFLREAVEVRYLSNDENKKAAHRSIAAYFAEREYAARRRDEEPWQWRAAGDLEALWNAFADPDFFSLFASEEQTYHFIAYLQTFEREHNEALLGTLAERMKDDTTIARRLDLARTARVAGYYPSATEILDAISEKASRDWKKEQSQLLLQKHEYQLALPICRELVSDIESLQGESEELFYAMINLSTVNHALGDLTEEKEILTRALSFSEVVDPTQRLAAMQNLAANELGQGNISKAVAMFKESYELSGTLQGKSNPTTLGYGVNFSASLIFDSRFAEAQQLLEFLAPIVRSSFGDRHFWYLSCLEHKAKISRELSQWGQALSIYSELIEKAESSLGANDPYTLKQQIALGGAHYLMGEHLTARSIYEAYLPKLTHILGSNDAWVKNAMNTLEKIKLDILGVE